MQTTGLALTLFLVSGATLPAVVQDTPNLVQAGPTSEPPQRVRVTVGGEVFELPMGGSVATGDGRTVSLELLQERHFDAPGSFSFHYPRDWRFLGSTGVPSPDDGWWNVGGEGVAAYLRRHTGDAEAIREEYLSNLESTQGSTRERATIELDGRFLVGGAVTYPSQGIGVGKLTSVWEQRVFTWQESDGVAWLLTLHRQTEPEYSRDGLSLILDARWDPAARIEMEQGRSDFEGPFQQLALQPAGSAELDALVASFRWR